MAVFLGQSCGLELGPNRELGNQIDPLQAKILSAIQQVSVVTVYLAKTMLSGTRKVDGINGTQKSRRRKRANTYTHRANQGGSYRHPLPDTIFFILREVFQNLLGFLRVYVVFA
jgi:hypothetical protein